MAQTSNFEIIFYGERTGGVLSGQIGSLTMQGTSEHHAFFAAIGVLEASGLWCAGFSMYAEGTKLFDCPHTVCFGRPTKEDILKNIQKFYEECMRFWAREYPFLTEDELMAMALGDMHFFQDDHEFCDPYVPQGDDWTEYLIEWFEGMPSSFSAALPYYRRIYRKATQKINEKKKTV